MLPRRRSKTTKVLVILVDEERECDLYFCVLRIVFFLVTYQQLHV